MSDVAAQYDHLAGEFLARIEATPEHRWGWTSPCEGWTARDVVAHVINGHRGITAMACGTQPQPGHGVALSGMADAPQVDPEADLATAFTECRARLLQVLVDPRLAQATVPGPMGLVTIEQAVNATGALELLVHTWDLSRAVGGDETLDADAVTRTHQVLQDHYAGLQATGSFLPSVQPPPNADPQTSFLCFTGRQP